MLLTDTRAMVCRPESYSAVALRALGRDPEQVERAHASQLRGAVASALAGIRTRETKNNPQGVDRSTLIRACGRHHAVQLGSRFDVEPQCCRQRACPSCARARARDNAKTLTRAMEKRALARSNVRFLFATLTQPKYSRRDESAREALDRMRENWRTLANSKTTRDDFHFYFAGGLRTTETTFSAAGDQHRNGGGDVEFSGFHVHLHVLIELQPNVSRADAAQWLIDAWLDIVDGASAAAQCIRPASCASEAPSGRSDAQELCKYVTKPLEDCRDKPAVLRELFGALHNVRLLQPFGQWCGRGDRKGWRELGSDEDKAPPRDHWRRGPECGELLRRVRRPVEGTTTAVYFRGRDPNDEVKVDAWTAWECIERVFKMRAGSPSAASATRAPLEPHPGNPALAEPEGRWRVAVRPRET